MRGIDSPALEYSTATKFAFAMLSAVLVDRIISIEFGAAYGYLLLLSKAMILQAECVLGKETVASCESISLQMKKSFAQARRLF